MRILHVNKFLYRRGGAEGYMLDLADIQRGAGHHVDFFAMAHPDNLPATYESLFPSGIELDPPPSALGDRVQIASRMVWSIQSKRRMERVVEEFRPDVVHLHNIYHQLSPSILQVLRRNGIPAVMTLHDYKLVCPTYQFLDHGEICEACLGRKFHKAVVRKCNADSRIASALVAAELAWHTVTSAYAPVDVFVCPSEFLLTKMRVGKVFPSRLRHVPHFSKMDGIAAANGPGLGVIVAGRLSREKGVDVAIDAVARLPNVQLTVCGDGPERSALEAHAAQAAPGRVRFTGRLSTAALHDEIRRSAMVIVPSRWYENQPMIVLEAFACGRTVIASNLGGLPELIRDGVDGTLVPPNDPAALANAIGLLMTDPYGSMTMGRRGRERALQEFSVSAHIARLDACYATAAASKREANR